MSKINYEELELEYLNTIFQDIENNYPLMEKTKLLPQYFSSEKHKKIFKAMRTFYKQNGTLNFIGLEKLDSTIDSNYLSDVYFNAPYCMSFKSWQYAENLIIEHHKETILNNLTMKKENGEIGYEEYVSKIKELDSIKITDTKDKMLTIKDINLSDEEPKIYVKSGINEFDKKVGGFILGEMSVWSGGNASGKSTFLNQLAIESINQDYKVAIYSGELTIKRLLNWLSMQCAGLKNLSFNEDKNYYFVNSYAKDKILRWLNDKLFIYDNSYGNDVINILESIQDCIVKNNVKVVIIDNLMAMNLETYGDNKYDIQSKFVQDLSSMAKKYNVHIHFVCHPRKTTTFLRKVDISGSADLTNIADNVFITHRINNDFKIRIKEMFKLSDSAEIFDYSNAIEVCKNRDRGIEDTFIGMYFDIPSKRLMNTKNENKVYNWAYLSNEVNR